MQGPFRWPRFVRTLHKWLALFVGAQLIIWTVTGFYMVAVHIDYIHGDHLVRAPAARAIPIDGLLSPGEIVARHPEAREVRLQRLFGRPVWRIQAGGATYLADGETGRRLAPLSEREIRSAAAEIYAGDDPITSAQLLTEAPREVGPRAPPFWRVEFAHWSRPTFYLSATTGELLTRRHQLWRVFDFAWMLHIMDYDAREDVNNPLLRVSTWVALVLTLSGAWLLLWSFPRRRRRRA